MSDATSKSLPLAAICSLATCRWRTLMLPTSSVILPVMRSGVPSEPSVSAMSFRPNGSLSRSEAHCFTVSVVLLAVDSGAPVSSCDNARSLRVSV